MDKATPPTRKPCTSYTSYTPNRFLIIHIPHKCLYCLNSIMLQNDFAHPQLCNRINPLLMLPSSCSVPPLCLERSQLCSHLLLIDVISYVPLNSPPWIYHHQSSGCQLEHIPSFVLLIKIEMLRMSSCPSLLPFNLHPTHPHSIHNTCHSKQ